MHFAALSLSFIVRAVVSVHKVNHPSDGKGFLMIVEGGYLS